MWDGFSHYAGGSAAAFNQLGALYGYRLIYCESHGVNCFLVREDLISDFSQNDDGGGSGDDDGGRGGRVVEVGDVEPGGEGWAGVG